MNRSAPLAIMLCALLAACAPRYSLVPPAPVGVAKGSFHVRPAMAWNRAPAGKRDLAWEENWTENGPLLDSIGFIGGLPDGQAITRQRARQDRKVPVFHATMSPPDLVSMIESYYRIKAGATVFDTRGVAPVTFLGVAGLRLDFAYTGADDVRRLGRAVVAVRDARLYMMTLDGAELHYFAAALPDFEAMAASASPG